MTSPINTAALDSQSFKAIAKLAYDESGLQLVAEKTSMIQSRLRHRLRALGLEDFGSYAQFVCSNEGLEERRQMISALTTNVSHFFRENHHFEILVNEAVASLIGRVRAGGRLRLWSAGCSNGQEAYSMTISLLEKYPDLVDLDFKVLATDIDPKVVDFARKGVYSDRLVGGVPATLLNKYFSTGGSEEIEYTANDILRQIIVFKELNLLAAWPMKAQMDAIFCRNVVIYFDLKTQNALWPRFRQQLSDVGYLFLGHSERIADPIAAGFRNVGPTCYRPVNSNAE
jgi:chemotaxis protein methyltransferase CheR